jgi:hypothetical protein
MLTQAHGVREVVDGMKVLDFASAAQMLGDDIGGENSIDVPGEWPGVVGGATCGTERVGQVVLCQNTLNSRYAGQGRDAQFLETCLNRARTNQAVARTRGRGLFEQLPKREHRLHDTRGHLLGRAVRRARAGGKVGVWV